RREDAEVLAVLPVDPLDVLGDHDADAGAHLRVRRLLAARALAAPLARDRDLELAGLDRPARDRELLARPEAQVREVSERVVVVVTDVGRRDLVGRDVVAELDRRVPVEVTTLELLPQEFRVLGEIEDAAGDADGVGPLEDWAREEALDHWDSV